MGCALGTECPAIKTYYTKEQPIKWFMVKGVYQWVCKECERPKLFPAARKYEEFKGEAPLYPVSCLCGGDCSNHDYCRCDGNFRRERGKSAPTPIHFTYAANRMTPEGFILCQWCGKVQNKKTLVECPECGKFFKGPKPNMKYNWECDDCG